VTMACVVAMPHPRWDERPVAIIVPANGNTSDTDGLKKTVMQVRRRLSLRRTLSVSRGIIIQDVNLFRSVRFLP
jgi:acyl-CoA synthetase (AMP-forming)/AMP-acid ligase II